MALPKSISELVENIRELSELGPQEEVRSALLYCVKQLKIAVAASRQEDE